MAKCKELEHQQADMRVELEIVRHELVCAENRSEDLERRLVEDADDLEGVKGYLEELNVDVKVGQIDGMEDEIGKMKDEIGEMKDENGEMKDDIGEMKDAVGEMKDEIGNVQSAIERLEIKVIQSHTEDLPAPALSLPNQQIHFKQQSKPFYNAPKSIPQLLEATRQHGFPGRIQMCISLEATDALQRHA